MENGTLRVLVDLRDKTIQKNRIAFGLRLGAVERGDDTASEQQISILKRYEERFALLESELDDDIRGMVDGLPIYQAMKQVKGVGPSLSARMLAMIDIREADTVSALWRYAGYGCINGERERPVKGETLHYNTRLKATLYVVATSFLKCSSPYRRVYDSAKEYYQANRSDWSKGHIHAASMRKMIKMFLSHFWMVYRELEGLPVRDLYVEEHLGHKHITTPQEFGWPETTSL